MKILHVSDTHGRFSQRFEEASVIVHTGDFMPNKTRGVRAIEPGHQEYWIRSVMPHLVEWCGDRPFLFMPGNHDFFDPCSIMRRAGISAHNLWEQGPKTVNGVHFGGVPFVPWMGGDWNYEAGEAEIEHYLTFLDDCDVFVTHCPPSGVLDRPYAGFGGRPGSIGSVAIRGYVEKRRPKWHLCGHCHECGGQREMLDETMVVNGATSARVIDIDAPPPHGGKE